MINNITIRTSWIFNQRKKIIYIIVLCFILLTIIIPTTIVLTKKVKSTTITTQTSTISTTTTQTSTISTTTTTTQTSTISTTTTTQTSTISTTTTTKAPLCYIGTNENPRWSQNGITVFGGNGSGDHLNQLKRPIDIYIDDNETVYIVDGENCCIVEWANGATSGKVIVNENELWNPTTNSSDCPRGVIVDKENDSLIFCTSGDTVMRWSRRNGTRGEIIISNVSCWGLMMDNDKYLYIADPQKNEVRQWQVGNTFGKVVAGGNGQGNRLDQLDNSMYIFVDQNQSVYVSDRFNGRVMKWVKDAKEGIIVAGGQTERNSLRQLSGPVGLIIDEFGNIYVADGSNNRVMRWSKDGTQVCIVVGGNGVGNHMNQLDFPLDLSFDQQGNLYVVDYLNSRVQKFDINAKNTEN